MSGQTRIHIFNIQPQQTSHGQLSYGSNQILATDKTGNMPLFKKVFQTLGFDDVFRAVYLDHNQTVSGLFQIDRV